MTKIERRAGVKLPAYGGVNFWCKSWNNIKPCGEQMRYFGAPYEDAVCIDGYLWDLGRCDNEGNLYSCGDNPRCPICNKQEFPRTKVVKVL